MQSRVFFLTTSIPNFVTFIDMLMHNTTSYVIDPGAQWSHFNCEYHSAGATATTNGNSADLYVNCYIHSPDGSNVIGLEVDDCILIGNVIEGFDGNGIQTLGATSTITNNIVISAGGSGILLTGDGAVIFQNTLVGDSTSGKSGVNITSGGVEKLFIMSNIMIDWGTGGSGGGIKMVAGANAIAIGYNHFFNNSEGDEVGVTVLGIDYGNDQTTDPQFTNAAGGDYSVGANAKAKGFPAAFPGVASTTSNVDTGAVQRAEPAAGGGGGGSMGIGI